VPTATDSLTEVIRERAANNPQFPHLVAEAGARRKFARTLAAVREGKALPHI